MARRAPAPVRLTLFLPGRHGSEAAWNQALRGTGVSLASGRLCGSSIAGVVEAELVANDGAFGQAFSFGTVGEELVREIDRVPAALVLQLPVDLRTARTAVVDLVRTLHRAGALAVRTEESKLGWEAGAWIAAMASDDPWIWHRTVVTFLHDAGSLQSCGMHAFSLPDVQAQIDGDASAVQELASTLNVYQLAEDPLLLSGHTFSPDAETPRRVLQRWPDASYPQGHACHNPFGVWRLGPPGGTGQPSGKTVPVFTPSLVATLAALQSRQRTPLTREQVEAARDGSPCMAVTHRDAQKLERERGYADIDPELAWEQWLVVQETRS